MNKLWFSSLTWQSAQSLIAQIDAALAAGEHRYESLTPRERDALNVIETYMGLHDGISPTLEEIGAALGISKVTAHELVQGLIAKGFVSRTGKRKRALEVLK